MKRNLIALSLLAFTALAFLLFSPAPQATPEQEPTPAVAAMACPNSPATIQGCIVDINGCPYVNTINGRQIAVNLSGVSVGVGDVASITGNFVIDADCAPCVLNATSATDLGDC